MIGLAILSDSSVASGGNGESYGYGWGGLLPASLTPDNSLK